MADFSTVPKDVLYIIIDYLGPASCQRFSITCKRFYSLFNDNLYKKLLQKHFLVTKKDNSKLDFLEQLQQYTIFTYIDRYIPKNINYFAMIRTHDFDFCYITKSGMFSYGDQQIENCKELATGGKHVLVLTKKGRVYATGRNTYGQLGIDKIMFGTEAKSIHEIPFKPKIVKIACGLDHSFMIDAKCRVWSFGQNDHGQLGFIRERKQTRHSSLIGKTLRDDVRKPALVNINEKIVNIACGEDFSFMINENGKVFACGNNLNGQLGCGVIIPMSKIREITFKTKIVSIACGQKHSLFLNEYGKVLSTGSNTRGQLGLGHYEDKYRPRMIETKSPITMIACGSSHSLLLDCKGQAWAFGDNTLRQLYCPSQASIKINTPVLVEINHKIKRISANYDYSVFIVQVDE